jgi:AcrR family transcriptional regulator
MSPKATDPQVREALVETAARLLAREGPAALSTRRLATELGTSTMAVYTHFGSMEGLQQAVRKEAFTRLIGHLEPVAATEDPVADLAALGWAYCFNALANPQLYRAVFLEPQIDSDAEIYGASAIQQSRDTVSRCIEARRFASADPESLAIQTWAGAHGMVTAALARLLTIEQVAEHFNAMGLNLFVGFGDDRELAERSIQRAEERMSNEAPPEPAQ